MLSHIGVACITIAVFLEGASYWKQGIKTWRTKRSGHVSSTSLLYKIVKYLFTLVGLAIYSNWVGFGIEVAALCMCCIVFYLVVKHKPKNWRMFK